MNCAGGMAIQLVDELPVAVRKNCAPFTTVVSDPPSIKPARTAMSLVMEATQPPLLITVCRTGKSPTEDKIILTGFPDKRGCSLALQRYCAIPLPVAVELSV